MSKHYEIERKFLIKMPQISFLEENKECQRVDIIQTYLKDKVRIRACKIGEEEVYIKTKKQKISDLVRIEEEGEITKKQYDTLLLTADTERQSIKKTRYKYPFDGKIFEIDIFSEWEDRALLEVELTDENEEFTVPPFLEIIKEVTYCKEYRNFALAKKFPKEKI